MPPRQSQMDLSNAAAAFTPEQNTNRKANAKSLINPYDSDEYRSEAHLLMLAKRWLGDDCYEVAEMEDCLWIANYTNICGGKAPPRDSLQKSNEIRIKYGFAPRDHR